MFQHFIEPFGAFQKHVLQSPDGRQRLAVVPDYGAHLLELQLHGTPVLDGYATPDEMLEGRYGKNIILYPFPNRLKEGKYEWAGRQYQFPINDPDTGNALHGFGKDKPLLVERVDTARHAASITCLRYEPGDTPAYPFPIAFAITFTLCNEGALEVDLSLTNYHESPIPVGMGWHPYFRLGSSADNMRLQLPPCRRVEVDATMIPTGQLLEDTRFAELQAINGQEIDNCFALDNTELPYAEVVLEGALGRLHYRQQTGPGKFNFLQVFVPPHRASIAIEPMTCNIDAFHNNMGLIVLEPQQQAVAGVRIAFEVSGKYGQAQR